MAIISEWIDSKIRDFFASSVPGEWGTEGSPEDGIPVLRSTNFRNNGTIDYSDIAFRRVDKERLNKRLVVNGTILIEKSGGSPTQAAGRVAYCDRDFNGTASNFIEVVKIRSDFCFHYVAYLLYHLYQTGLVLKYQQQTTGIINFKLKEYAEEVVPYPVLKTEQAQIVAILSKMDEAIERTEALIVKQQRLKTGLMQDLLTRGIDQQGNIRSEQTHAFKDSQFGKIPEEWNVGSLLDATESKRQPILTGPFGADLGGDDFVADGIPVLRIGNVQQGRMDLSDLLFVSTDKAAELSRYKVQTGDLLFARQGATTGRNALVDELSNGCLINYHIIRVALDHERCSPLFIEALFDSEFVKRQINREKGRGTREGINTAQLKVLQLTLPPLWEQRKIAKILSSVAMHVSAAQVIVAKLCQLKTALMQDLLTGKRRVTPLLEMKGRTE